MLKYLNRNIEMFFSVILLCTLFAVLVYRIFARTFTGILSNFNISVHLPSFWTQEFCGILFINLSLLAISLGVREGLHVRVVFIVSKFSTRWQNIIEVLTLLMIFFVFCLIAKYGWEFAMRKSNQMMDSMPYSKIWIYAPLPIFSVLINIRLAERLYYVLTNFNKPLHIFDSEDTII